MRLDAGTAFPVPETGALIVGGGKELKVVFSPGEQERRSPYKSVDLREGDIVLMANGKRVRSVADLTRAYDSTLVGSEFKLGIQRGQEMMIVAYPKADPASFPKRQVRMITADQEGVAVFPAVGVLLEEKSGRVVVQDLLPSGSSAVEKLDVRAGDVITSINGKRVTTVKAYSEAYDALAVGSRVTWDTERAGKRLTVSFAKPTPVGPTVIRKTVE
jgi:S1-C subfamily serine protease